MAVMKKPARWTRSDQAIRAVQVAFDVEQSVLEAVRSAAFQNQISTSDQIRDLLGLPVPTRPKRPRLTVSLTAEDYRILGTTYGIDPEDALAIKERVTEELIRFASKGQRKR